MTKIKKKMPGTAHFFKKKLMLVHPTFPMAKSKIIYCQLLQIIHEALN